MTMLPDDLIKRRAKKIVDSGALSTNSIPLAVLSENIIINDNLEALAEAIKSIPSVVIPESVEVTNLPEYPSEMAISNLPDIQKVEITNLPKDKDDKETIKKLSEIAEELKKKGNIDLSSLETSLDEILKSVDSLYSKEDEKLTPEFTKVQELLKTINENLVTIDIPDFDYEKLADIIKKNLKISVAGGGSHKAVNLENASGARINPATEEKQDSIITAIGNLSIVIDSETPSGVINGVNVNFTTYYNYKPGTTKIWLNGIRQREGLGYDYIENGTNSIVYGVPPSGADTLLVDYTKL